jgi:hypothetical protein
VNVLSSFYRLLIALLLGSLCLAKDKPSDHEGADLLAKATSLQNLHEQGAQAFQLRMRVHAEHIAPKPTDGAYAEVWMAQNKWRREVAFPGFTQLEIGDVDSKWITRNFDSRPRAVYLTEVAVEHFIHPGAQQETVIKSVRRRKVKGVELRCVEVLDKEGKQGGNSVSTGPMLWFQFPRGTGVSSMPTSASPVTKFSRRAFVFTNQACRSWTSAPTI